MTFFYEYDLYFNNRPIKNSFSKIKEKFLPHRNLELFQNIISEYSVWIRTNNIG